MRICPCMQIDVLSDPKNSISRGYVDPRLKICISFGDVLASFLLLYRDSGLSDLFRLQLRPNTKSWGNLGYKFNREKHCQIYQIFGKNTHTPLCMLLPDYTMFDHHAATERQVKAAFFWLEILHFTRPADDHGRDIDFGGGHRDLGFIVVCTLNDYTDPQGGLGFLACSGQMVNGESFL